MSIKCDQNRLKNQPLQRFSITRVNPRVDLCGAEQKVTVLYLQLAQTIEVDPGVNPWHRDRPQDHLLWVCQSKIACRSVPFDRDRSRGQLFSLNLIFSQNIYPKNMKLPSINHKSSVLTLEAFESELDMILSLKYNKSFSKPKSLITSLNIL